MSTPISGHPDWPRPEDMPHAPKKAANNQETHMEHRAITSHMSLFHGKQFPLTSRLTKVDPKSAV